MARRKTTEEFVREAREIHGDLYGYDQSNYVSAHEKIKVICPIHGVFFQAPHEHLRGGGCKRCAQGRNASDTRRDFVRKATSKHGKRFDYSLVDYKNSRTKVKIICSVHGVYKQSPADHLTGHSCKKCARNGSFREDLQGTLYYYRLEAPGRAPLYKVGITNHQNPNRRASKWRVAGGVTYTLIHKEHGDGAAIRNKETEILRLYKPYLVGDAAREIMKKGHSEVFSRDVLKLDEVQ